GFASIHESPPSIDIHAWRPPAWRHTGPTKLERLLGEYARTQRAWRAQALAESRSSWDEDGRHAKKTPQRIPNGSGSGTRSPKVRVFCAQSFAGIWYVVLREIETLINIVFVCLPYVFYIAW